MRRHGNQRAIRETELAMVPELLDARKDIVPPPAIESRRMLTHLVQDLVHLERGKNGLDQHRRLDRAARDAEPVLRHDEDVVPQPRLEMAFELGQIKIGRGASREELFGVVEKIYREIEEAARDRLPIDPDVLFGQVPAGRTHEQDGHLVV